MLDVDYYGYLKMKTDIDISFSLFVFAFGLLSTLRIVTKRGWWSLKNAWDGCYSISKGMFRNLIRPSSEHTFYTHVSLAPHSKSLH